ncbi:YgaP family membrane protein [Rappaport israeli]|uniref:YgaP family membrane protein n=1 Tax=Rappaport israeli TaxID=1839807 RepID=UPI000931C57E
MPCNLGKMERIARGVLGLLLVVLAATGTIGWWGYLGAIFIATAAISFCPIWRLLGISTCKKID